mmetsp:Transcript_16247/g.25992  ORF Transcript_16247/g.25992 Transcript_16247/m.25992 type:complete len:115 (-) Transcript_16247:643-987(-)
MVTSVYCVHLIIIPRPIIKCIKIEALCYHICHPDHTSSYIIIIIIIITIFITIATTVTINLANVSLSSFSFNIYPSMYAPLHNPPYPGQHHLQPASGDCLVCATLLPTNYCSRY